jgi:hypothetical protein
MCVAMGGAGGAEGSFVARKDRIEALAREGRGVRAA